MLWWHGQLEAKHDTAVELTGSLEYMTGSTTQLWVRMVRRTRRLISRRTEVTLEVVQVLLVSIIMGLAFSHEDDPVENPYYDVLWLFMATTYLFALTYLNSCTEYMQERALLWKECDSGQVRIESYFLSFWFVEIPRSTLHLLVVFCIGYPWVVQDSSNFAKIFLVMWLGSVAWQGCVGMAAAITDSEKVLMNVMLLVMGMGSMFAGVVIAWDSISPVFLWCHYATPMSFTIRLQILLQLSGNSIYYVPCETVIGSTRDTLQDTGQFTSTVESLNNPTQTCLQGLQYGNSTSNSTTPMQNPINVGDIYLGRLEFQDSFTVLSCIILIEFAVFSRILAILIFKCRIRNEHRLKHESLDVEASETDEAPGKQSGTTLLLTEKCEDPTAGESELC